MKCNKCGYENKEEAKFCNQCGMELEENNNVIEVQTKDNTTIKKSILIKHKRTSIVILILVLISSIGSIGYFHYGIGMSEQQKNSRINDMVSAKKYNEARGMNDRYFKGNDKITKLTHDLHKNVIDLCETSGTTNLEEVLNKYKQLQIESK